LRQPLASYSLARADALRSQLVLRVCAGMQPLEDTRHGDDLNVEGISSSAAVSMAWPVA